MSLIATSVPRFRVAGQGVKINQEAFSKLQSVRISDRAGFESDSLQLVFSARSELQVPQERAELIAYIGYNGEFQQMGIFTVNKVVESFANSGRKLTVIARGADMRQSLKDHKTRGFENVTLGEIVSTIAAEHGLEPVVSDSLKDIPFERIDQTAQSDLAFLTGLAKRLDAVSKPVAGRLIMAPMGEAKSASGKQLEKTVIRYSKITTATVDTEDRKDVNSVTARWHDKASGMAKTVTAGNGAPVQEIKRMFAFENEADLAANAKLKQLQRGRQTLRLSMPGTPNVSAEAPIETVGFSDRVDGGWSVDTVDHNLSKSGFRTSLTAKLPNS
jgi:phage protein D